MAITQTLTDLKPRWISDAQGRHGMGISILCPTCLQMRICVWFVNPVDGGPARVFPEGRPAVHWQRTGESFADLTLAPSIDASNGNPPCSFESGDPELSHWHGHITDGKVV